MAVGTWRLRFKFSLSLGNDADVVSSPLALPATSSKKKTPLAVEKLFAIDVGRD
jgi:hypothetical protein